MNTKTIYLEDDNEEVNFSQETLSFILNMPKIWTNMFIYIYLYNKWPSINLKGIAIALGQTRICYKKQLW